MIKAYMELGDGSAYLLGHTNGDFFTVLPGPEGVALSLEEATSWGKSLHEVEGWSPLGDMSEAV